VRLKSKENKTYRRKYVQERAQVHLLMMDTYQPLRVYGCRVLAL
jgi:hypothetical protein